MKTLISSPYLLLFSSALLWGLSGIADKYAVSKVHPYTVQWLYALPYIASLPLWYWLSQRAAPGIRPDAVTTLWAMAASSLTLLGMFLLFLSMRSMPPSLAMAITSIYPLITLLIGVGLRQETLTLPKAVGILLIVSGVFVLVLNEH